MEIHIAYIRYGQYDDQDFGIVYAGIDLIEAEKQCNISIDHFKNQWNPYCYIETWKDGKKVKETSMS